MRRITIFAVALVLATSCSNPKSIDIESDNSNVSIQEESENVNPEKSLPLLSSRQKLLLTRSSIETEMENEILFGLTEDTVPEKKDVYIDVDEAFDYLTISMDLGIETYEDFDPDLEFCRDISSFALRRLFSVYRKWESSPIPRNGTSEVFYLEAPKKGYKLELVWNAYYRKVDEYGAEVYKLKKNYGYDRVFVSTSNWNQIVTDSDFNTQADFFKLSDLKRAEKSSYPACEYN